MSIAEAQTSSINCKDLLEFQHLLNKLRVGEDKILFKLNCDLPTNSFANKTKAKSVCDDIEKKLLELRRQRTDIIYKCAKENKTVVNDFRNEKDKQSELRIAHQNLRLLKNEYNVEEIIIKQTDKTVHERCRKELL